MGTRYFVCLAEASDPLAAERMYPLLLTCRNEGSYLTGLTKQEQIRGGKVTAS